MPINNPASVTAFDIATLQTDRPICVPGGRLTLSSGAPVADVASSTTFYYLPFNHGMVPLWNDIGEYWEYRPIPDVGITLNRSGDNPRIFDVYATARPNEPDTVGTDVQSWADNTTRFIPLVRVNGIRVLAFTGGVPLRPTYLGTIRSIGTTGNAQMTDTETQRFVFNAYNQVEKRVLRLESTASWTYNSSTWRPWNNSNLNRIEVVDGIGNGILDLTFSPRAICPTESIAQYGFAMDVTNTVTDSYFLGAGDHFVFNRFVRVPGLGYHFCQAMESISGSGTVTFYSGGLYGLRGTWQC